MSRHREALESIYDHRYHRLNGERGEFYWLCVICGAPAGSIEHYPPLSRISDYEALGGRVYVKFPCCSQCNGMAGTILDDNVLDRIERVKDRIARKYAKYINNTEWDDDELADLGKNLRSYVATENDKGAHYRAKIEYYAGIDLFLDSLYEIYGEPN